MHWTKYVLYLAEKNIDINSSVNFLGFGELLMTRWMYKLPANKSYHWFDTFLKNVFNGLRFQSQTGLHTQTYCPDILYCIWLL